MAKKKAKTTDDLLRLSNKANRELFENFVKRLRKGDDLSATELKQFREIEAQLKEEQLFSQKKQENRWIVTTQDLADFFGLTSRQIYNWNKDLGCPQIKRGYWNLKDVLKWWLETLYEDTLDKTDATIKSYRQQKAKYDAEAAKLKVEKLRDEYFLKADIAKEWAKRVSEICSGLAALANRLPGVLWGKSKAEMRAKIEEEIWGLRDNYARDGRFTPKINGNEESEI